MAQRNLRAIGTSSLRRTGEAKATAAALAVIVAVWLVGGFGLAGFDVQLFGTPLWIIAGCMGTWVAAVIAAIVLARFVFADFPLDDEEGLDG
ncbi:MAG: DUF997 family protein [Eggerthella lenta]